jgi:hypothetical protein
VRASRAWLACLLLVPTLACEAGGQVPADAPGRDRSARSAAAAGDEESLRAKAVALLDERERALTEGDREAFLATVDPDELGFSATQARWFDNLARLPVGDVSFDLGDEDALADDFDDGELRLPVDFTMRLRGFDSRPVTDEMVWTFVHRDGDVLLVGDRDEEVDLVNGWIPAPWDLAHIEVRRSGGILAVFDEDTSEHATYVMSDLADATAVVRRHFPEWSGRYVAYGTSDTTAIAEMSGMGVDQTAGVAFPVLARPDGPVAAYRFAVNPTVVGDVLARGLVFRHELAHVALGPTDDRSPVWLMEGAAEYVARSTMSVDERRRIAAYQLAAASARTLEPTRSFYRGDPTLSYNLAAVVCDYIATTRGEAALWDLVRAFRTARIFSAAQTEGVVRRELGLSTKDLSAQSLAWARSA